MSPMELTVFVIVAILFLVIFVDVVLAVHREGVTYSEAITAGARRWPPLVMLVSVGVGLLLGHWFWPPSVDC